MAARMFGTWKLSFLMTNRTSSSNSFVRALMVGRGGMGGMGGRGTGDDGRGRGERRDRRGRME